MCSAYRQIMNANNDAINATLGGRTLKSHMNS